MIGSIKNIYLRRVLGLCEGQKPLPVFSHRHELSDPRNQRRLQAGVEGYAMTPATEIILLRRENEVERCRAREMRQCLYAVLNYLEQRQDVEDSPSGYGPQVPDETMRLAVYVRETLRHDR